MRQQRCGKQESRLTECEAPWPEDGGSSNLPQDQGTPMSETINDYIYRVKTFSTFIRPRGAPTSLELLTLLRPEKDPPK
jgi:hypothetical protein